MSDNKYQGVTLVPDETADQLLERQLTDYRHHRRKLIKWMCNFGKDPKRAEGYAHETVERRAYDLDRFYRWVWNEYDRYTTVITHDYADDYSKELAYTDESDTYKVNMQKSIKMLFRWRAFEFDDEEWEPEIAFSDSGSATQSRKYMSKDELRMLREAALSFGSVPHYNSLSPEKREEMKLYLAQRFSKPMDDIGADDFDRANGYKIASLVATSIDAALRPIEVARAKTSWIDAPNAVLRIPADDAAKSNENWVVSLQERTAKLLEEWLHERQCYEKYDDTDSLWLTREANSYSSQSLKRLLHRVCEDTPIDAEGRNLTWYTIRRGVATALADERGLAAAQAQLRHSSVETTMKYDQTPPEERRNALGKFT